MPLYYYQSPINNVTSNVNNAEPIVEMHVADFAHDSDYIIPCKESKMARIILNIFSFSLFTVQHNIQYKLNMGICSRRLSR